MPTKTKQHVLCIGSAGRDVFFPTDAGTVVDAHDHDTKKWCFDYGAKMHVEDRFSAPGGCACNVSVALARLGIDATAYGLVGADSDGHWIIEELLRDGVDTEYLRVREERNSDLSFILVDEARGERMIFANRDVGEELVVDGREIAFYPWIFVGSLYGEGRIGNMQKIHDVTRKGKSALIYNPGMANITEDMRWVYNLLHHSRLIFVNKKEAQEIVLRGEKRYTEDKLQSEAFLVQTIADHAERGAIVVLTYGAHGAWVCADGTIYYLGTKSADITDATGAGDAFASGFLAGHLMGMSVEESMQWGAANSHSVIGYYGAHKGLLTRDAITREGNTFSVERVS